MGRLEKIVVVVVLFLVAVILGVSLSTDGEGSSPIAGRKPRSEPPAAAPREDSSREGPESAGGLMNAAGSASDSAKVSPETPSAQPNAPQPAPIGGAPLSMTPISTAPDASSASTPQPGAPQLGAPQLGTGSPLVRPGERIESQYLVSREGLAPTASEELMLYTWKAGDTFKALSEKYYGSPLHVARVRNANEGRKEELLVAGDKILVPSLPAAAADRITRNTAQDPKDAKEPATTWTGGPYTVSSGDVLGTISQKVYGTSKKWKKIFDANRDVIGENPNALKVGMELRIPE